MWIERAGLTLLDIGIDGDFRHGRAEETPSDRGFPDSANQIFLSAAFEDVTDRAVLECLGDEGVTAVH